MKAAILVIGNLGQSGEISLRSLIELEPKRVCVVANNSGRDWLNNLDWLYQSVMCFHEIEQNSINRIDRIFSLNDYSEYRTLNFDLLTILKWHLLLDIFAKHRDTHRVLYSDLDVYWNSKPSKNLVLDQSDNVWIQYTPNSLRWNWYCTGIMSWSNTTNNKLALKKLIQAQDYSFKSETPRNDEVTFNHYKDKLPINIKKLSTKKYLVGREFNKVFFAYSLYFPNLICFHANYFTGEHLKAKILKILKIRLSTKVIWIKYIPLVIIFNLSDMYRRLRRKIR